MISVTSNQRSNHVFWKNCCMRHSQSLLRPGIWPWIRLPPIPGMSMTGGRLGSPASCCSTASPVGSSTVMPARATPSSAAAKRSAAARRVAPLAFILVRRQILAPVL